MIKKPAAEFVTDPPADAREGFKVVAFTTENRFA
jgi:hypothetical protein